MDIDMNAHPVAGSELGGGGLHRRDVMKGAALAAGGALAVGGLNTTPAMAQDRLGEAPIGDTGKVPTPFALSEYERRSAAVKAQMAALDIDTAFFHSDVSALYLTGALYGYYYTGHGLILGANDTLPYWFLRKQDVPAARFTSALPIPNIDAYPEIYVGSREVDCFDYILPIVQDRWKPRRIGMETADMTESMKQRFKSYFPNSTIVDTSGMIEKIRIVKSPIELEVMRQAARISDAMMVGAARTIRPGALEADVTAEMARIQIYGADGYRGTSVDGGQLAGGNMTGTIHISWTNQRIQRGKHYCLEFSGWRFRYPSPLMRTVSVGKPSEKLARLHSYMMEGCAAALETVKPGATCGEVAQAFSRAMARGGYSIDGRRQGYPVGLDWMESSCFMRVDDPTVLKENMTFHLMLGSWVEEYFGATLSETFAVTATGAEVFGRYPRELVIV